MTVAVDFFQVAEDGQSKKNYKNGLLVDKGFFLSLLNIDSGFQLTNNKWETKYNKLNSAFYYYFISIDFVVFC